MSEVTLGLKRAAVLCVLKSKDSNNYLLLKRNKEPHLNKYIPVGGKLEPFEDPDTAAKREVFEETGITIDSMRLRGIMTETSPVKFNWINYIYIGMVEHFTPDYCNEGSLEWVAEEKILELPTPTTDWYIYNLLLQKDFFVLDAQYDAELNLKLLKNKIDESILYEN